MTNPASVSTDPRLPQDRGEVSAAVLGRLAGRSPALPDPATVERCAPYGDDLQLALYALYELHYQGFDGVDDHLEWDPDLLHVRAGLEKRFLTALRADTPGGGGAEETLAELMDEPAGGRGSTSHFLLRKGEMWQLREYAALRSLYHLKEADPQLWVVPRLRGRPKAGMVAVEYDEFGAGRAEDIHARLYADLMDDLGLDASYGAHLDTAPSEMLAIVTMMSLFGLHRALRGALVGHFAAVEVASSPGSARMADALRRCGAGRAAQRFYDEHVEADAVHEQLVRHEVVAPLLADEPHLEDDVVLGVQATGLLEDRLTTHLLTCWDKGQSALLAPG
ncbi:iron-containing redox enzyme family protein [Streptomyces sp. JV185]|nr:iron-containing redox enzyme family protein [Streptomyces sp. JV185]MEE1772488.1 iron-containing redox enzyme family protein [Streptomyces sp. JV185]